MTTNLTAAIYNDEDAARAHFEAIRWPDGRVCPHCGTIDNSTLMQGKTTRAGLYKCKEKVCRKPFSATMGTIYERSHIPLNKWLLATQLMVSSKKGMSAHQLFRMLGFGSYRTAWFMAHRIREAMRSDDLTPLGNGGGTVEADETYIGRRKGEKVRTGGGHKMKILSLVDRNSGVVRSFTDDKLTAAEIHPIIRANIAREARLMTDEARLYTNVGKEFAANDTVMHAGLEYVRGDAYTNTVEGYFSIFKRGMRGVYQHCGEQHLHRYLAEFDFRYTNRIAVGINDNGRAVKALHGTVGKRLTYKKPDIKHAA